MTDTAAIAVSSFSQSPRWSHWTLTQAWLAEIVRATVSTAYTELEGDEGQASGVHQNAIVGRVTKAVGALFELAQPEFSISETIDLLVRLGDLGDLGNGYIIPRESRLMILDSAWGRVVGGLPMQPQDYSELEVAPLRCKTMGRIVSLPQDLEISRTTLEHSEILWWSRSGITEVTGYLTNQLPQRTCTKPSEDAIRFYHASYQRNGYRKTRWKTDAPVEPFAIARSITLPARYFVCLDNRNSGTIWFPIMSEQARKWILLAERYHATTNRLYMEEQDYALKIRLPDMLPTAWTSALLACASNVTVIERGWEAVIADEVRPCFELLLSASNIRPR